MNGAIGGEANTNLNLRNEHPNEQLGHAHPNHPNEHRNEQLGHAHAYEHPNERWLIVHAQLATIAKQRAALDAEEARWLREAEQLQIWKTFGMVSMLDYLERSVGYAPRTAHDRLRVARALGDLPELTEALATGELFHSAIRELVRVATPRTESAWRQAARGKNVREIEKLVAGHRPGDLPDDPPDEQARLYAVTFEDVDAPTFALARQARQILDEEHGTRMSDAQVLAAMASAIVHGAPRTEHGGRARNQIHYTVCPSCDRATQEGAGVAVPIDATALARARCDAQHIGSTHVGTPARAENTPRATQDIPRAAQDVPNVIQDPRRATQDVPRATQDIPPSTVRFVWRRDGGVCQTPGCRSARGLEIHHIVARADGGTHHPSNLTLRCSACHGAHHAGKITIRGVAPHALETIRNVIVPAAPMSPIERQNGPIPLPSRSAKYEAAVKRTELITALTTSGWTTSVARAAVDAACAHVGANATFEELLRESFRRCTRT